MTPAENANWKYLSLMACLVLALATTSCKKVSSRQALDNIRSLEDKVEKNRSKSERGRTKADVDLIHQLGIAYEQFADQYPDAPETPEFLFRGGELYSNDLQDFTKAISLFKRNHERYPSHETAANALFFVAYLYNNSLHDLTQAELAYKEFLQNYPEHKMAQSAKFELQSLGMSVDSAFDHLVRPADSSSATDSVHS